MELPSFQVPTTAPKLPNLHLHHVNSQSFHHSKRPILKSFQRIRRTQILRCLIRATKSVYPPITTVGAPTINRIVKRLNYKFTLSQINDKLRRQRIKYHKHARSKSLVRTHHDRRIYKLSKRIWEKKITPKKNEKVEERMESGKGDGVWNLDKFPYLVAEFSRVLPDNEVWKERMKRLEEKKLRKMDQDWVFIKVEEAKLVTTIN